MTTTKSEMTKNYAEIITMGSTANKNRIAWSKKQEGQIGSWYLCPSAQELFKLFDLDLATLSLDDFVAEVPCPFYYKSGEDVNDPNRKAAIPAEIKTIEVEGIKYSATITPAVKGVKGRTIVLTENVTSWTMLHTFMVFLHHALWGDTQPSAAELTGVESIVDRIEGEQAKKALAWLNKKLGKTTE